MESHKTSCSCPVCRRPAPLLYDLFDDRHGYPGRFSYHRCPACGVVFQNQTMTDREIGELYSMYYPRSTFNIAVWKPYIFKRGFQSWLSGYSNAFMRVPEKVRVLDIGCGFGETIGYHKARGCEVYGVEMDDAALKVAEVYSLDIRKGPFRADAWKNEFFDYVTLDQVLEHCYEPLPLLKDIRKVLKKEGRLIFTTPNADGLGSKIFSSRWIHWHPPYHVRLYTRRSLTALLEQAGFCLDSLTTVTGSAWMQYQMVHLFTHPEEGQRSSFWDSRAPKRNIGQKMIIALAGLLYQAKVFHFATRFIDCLKRGDNFVGVAIPQPHN